MNPQLRQSFAVRRGIYAGEIMILVEKTKVTYNFLSIPLMKNRCIPIDKFELGWKNGIIQFVEMIPINVYKTVNLQFKRNYTENK